MTRRAAWPRHVRREHDSHAHRGCRAGRGFRTIIDGYGVPQVRAVATSAVREAGAEATAARNAAVLRPASPVSCAGAPAGGGAPDRSAGPRAPESCVDPSARVAERFADVAHRRTAGHCRRNVAGYGAGTAVRVPGMICGWKENPSRDLASTTTLSHRTSLLPLTGCCRRAGSTAGHPTGRSRRGSSLRVRSSGDGHVKTLKRAAPVTVAARRSPAVRCR